VAVDLGKQYGPLPLGAWIVVVGGGLGIAYWQSTKSSGDEEPEIVEDTGSPDGVGEGPGGYEYVPPSDSSGSDVDYSSNEAWGQAAINWLVANGYDAGISNSAITKALAGGVDVEGNKMSVQEWSLWSLALIEFGSPPYPVNVSPPSSTPGPTKPPTDSDTPTPITVPRPEPEKPGNTPGHYTYVTVKGDTPTLIVKKTNKMFGVKNSWGDIFKFNQKWRDDKISVQYAFAGGHIWWIPKNKK
jgi:hypothetical protein